MIGISFKNNVSGPSNHLKHLILLEVLNTFELLLFVKYANKARFHFEIRQLRVQSKVERKIISRIKIIDKAITHEEFGITFITVAYRNWVSSGNIL